MLGYGGNLVCNESDLFACLHGHFHTPSKLNLASLKQDEKSARVFLMDGLFFVLQVMHKFKLNTLYFKLTP